MTPLMNTNAYLFLDKRAEGQPQAVGDLDRLSRMAAAPGGGTLKAGERVILGCGTEMAGLRRWVIKSAGPQSAHHDVLLNVVELARKRAFFVEMRYVMIDSFALPALDRLQKGPAFATVTLMPESTRVFAGRFSSDPKAAGYVGMPAIPWSASRFKLKIAGLETESAVVTKIEAITFHQLLRKAGDAWSEIKPTGTRWSSLRVSFPHSHLARVQQWHRSTSDGPTDGARVGSLEYFSVRGVTPIFTLSFDILPVALSVRGSGVTLECSIKSVQAES